MADKSRVWIRKRKCKGKTTYHLRWVCPQEHKWKSRCVGTDSKLADLAAAKLKDELDGGTYRNPKKITWADFVSEHVELITGKSNATEAKYTLDNFGERFNVAPKQVTYTMIELYAKYLRQKGNSQATINKRLRYLRTAFRKAVKRGYIAKSPMEGWMWASVDQKEIRVATEAEETALLEAGGELYGFQIQAFIEAALGTGGRRGELASLTWDRIDLTDESILFTGTKGKRDRRIPINPELVTTLRKLQIQTLQKPGPFYRLDENMSHKWPRIVAKAEIPDITFHDLRRTYISRMARAGISMPTVQELAGHTKLETTRRYYIRVDDKDKRAAVNKLRRSATGA